MQSTAWIALLKRIPPAQHDNLLLLTSIGTEITIQALLRTEEEYLVLRGRVAGTTDAGRIFFVPYDQINYLGFHKAVKEADVHALYGETAPPPPPKPEEPPPAPLQELPEPEPPPPEPPQLPEPSPEMKPSKVILLERLRARLAAAVTKSSKS